MNQASSGLPRTFGPNAASVMITRIIAGSRAAAISRLGRRVQR
jgi:hypothetical protein